MADAPAQMPAVHVPHPLDGALTQAHAAMEEHLSKVGTSNFIGYQVTIRVPIHAEDDPMARQVAKGILPFISGNASVKLQKIYRDRSPEAVTLT